LRQNGQIFPQNEEDRDLFCLFHFFHGFARKAFIYEDFGDLMNICFFNIRETAFALVLFYKPALMIPVGIATAPTPR